MFDIGFPELLLVSVVALVVIGPEKLPTTIRTLSIWLGRLRNSLTTLRDEIEAEINADELKRQFEDDDLMRDVKETRDQLDEIITSAKKEMNEIKSPVPPHDAITKPTGNGFSSTDGENERTDDRDPGRDEDPDKVPH